MPAIRRNQSRNLRLRSLPTWRPEQYRRLLILAPHPDDEVLAAGGVIATALSATHSPQIRVIVATNGDGSYSTAWLNGHNPASHHGFRRLSIERQRESAEALASLGLPPDHVHFWGFPDRGLEPIWQHHWASKAPYHSRTTGLTASTSGSMMPYTSQSLLTSLRRTLIDFQPDALIVPHTDDAHPDHRALARFAALAVALNQTHRASPRLDMFGYVVWLRGNPRPRSLRLGQNSRLPVRLCAGDTWLRLPLTRDMVQRKELALRCYHSQMRPLGSLLRNRASADSEVFAKLHPYLVLRPDWQTWPHRGHKLIAAPTALWGAVDRATLRLAAQLSRPPRKGYDYTFVIRTVRDYPIETRLPADEFVPIAGGGVLALAHFPLTGSGQHRPAHAIAIALETRLHRRIVTAHSSWQLVYTTGDNYS